MNRVKKIIGQRMDNPLPIGCRRHFIIGATNLMINEFILLANLSILGSILVSAYRQPLFFLFVGNLDLAFLYDFELKFYYLDQWSYLLRYLAEQIIKLIRAYSSSR